VDVEEMKAEGIDVLVSLLEAAEAVDLGLAEEERQCSEAGIEFVSVPVPDRGVPEHGQEFRAVAERLLAQVAASRTVAIHCRAGIGRSSLLVATILVLSGASPGDAWTKIAKARGLPVPDTAEQRRWLDSMVLGTRS
jgi:protein-tyrosine phosphatase